MHVYRLNTSISFINMGMYGLSMSKQILKMVPTPEVKIAGAKPIPEKVKRQIVYHIDVYGIGYTYISRLFGELKSKNVKVRFSELSNKKQKFYKIKIMVWTGYSRTKLNSNGIFTNNMPVTHYVKYSVISSRKVKHYPISLTKIQEKQLNRVNFEDIRDIWTCQIDGSDFSTKSSRIANKQSRTWKITLKDGSIRQIKMYGLYCRTGYTDIIFKVQKSSGETKSNFAELITNNLGKIGKHIILDSQAKFKDLQELGIKVYHPKKSVYHPHNSEVEGLFGKIKGLAHNEINQKYFKTCSLYEAVKRLNELKQICLNNKPISMPTNWIKEN